MRVLHALVHMIIDKLMYHDHTFPRESDEFHIIKQRTGEANRSGG